MDHCNGPVSWDHYVHVHHIHEWERLRGLGGEEKDGTEEDHFLPWLRGGRGGEKDHTEMQERGKKGKEEENKGRYPVGPTMI